MRTTYDAEVDAAYVHLTTDTTRGRSVHNVEVASKASGGGSVVLDFDQHGVLLGVEVLGASRVLDDSFVSQAERIDR